MVFPGEEQGIRSIIGRHKIDGGKVKNGIGNREFKCTTHGHELRRGNAGGLGVPGRGYKGGKNWKTVIA